MTKFQSFLELASRMINAGMDEIAVAEVLVDQINEHISELKCQAFDSLPVIETKTIVVYEDDEEDLDVPNWSEEKTGW